MVLNGNNHIFISQFSGLVSEERIRICALFLCISRLLRFSFLFLQSNTIYFRNGKYQKKTGMVEDQIADGTAFCRCTEHDPGASSEYDLYKREVS